MIGEITGILVATGALITSIVTIMISGIQGIKEKIEEFRAGQRGTTSSIDYDTAHCNILTFGNTVISYLPLSTHTISFIIGYLFMAAVPNLYIVIPLLIFLIIDVAYNYMKCSGVFVIIPLAIGLMLGVGWGSLSKPLFTTTLKMKSLTTTSFRLLILVLFSCQGVAQKEGTINKTISPTEFEQKLALPEIQLIDVRSPEEYADGGIKGSVNINYNGADFEERIAKLNKEKPVLVYCPHALVVLAITKSEVGILTVPVKRHSIC
jgi:hypothetical protein